MSYPSWEETYSKVLEKCQDALDRDRRFIEIRPYYDHRKPGNYRLYAHTKHYGYRCVAFGFQYHTVEDWARAITQQIARAGWCKQEGQ